MLIYVYYKTIVIGIFVLQSFISNNQNADLINKNETIIDHILLFFRLAAIFGFALGSVVAFVVSNYWYLPSIASLGLHLMVLISCMIVSVILFFVFYWSKA